jgi:hypothetical protein
MPERYRTIDALIADNQATLLAAYDKPGDGMTGSDTQT